MRRQLRREFRKPLVVFTPKSLLRHPLCVSTLEDLSRGRFQELIDDVQVKPSAVEKVVFCSGKIYYELLQEREKTARMDVALVRLEQLYPLPEEQINTVLEKYKGKSLIWVQEEPKNMGAWTHILNRLQHLQFELIASRASAATASGSSKQAAHRQRLIIEEVFK
jgi:2-oxoglutarate dehydrogenase E1 component